MKKLCSEQLESLSKRQLESIITGKEMASSDNESTNEQEKLDELQPVEGILQKQNVNEERKRKQVVNLLPLKCITQKLLLCGKS